MHSNYVPGVGFTVGILSHLLKIDDALIGAFACLSKVLSGIVFAFAPSEFFFYIGKSCVERLHEKCFTSSHEYKSPRYIAFA